MQAPAVRVFTPARIVALVLIAVVVIGLLYLRFGTGEASVSVPAGAQAGDLVMEPGTFDTENGSYAAEYGTLVVPENRSDPGSRLIALPVTRIRAQSDHPAEPIFRLEGGPGISNMEFFYASRFAENHDVVLVGYRGIDGSQVLDSPEVVSALKHSPDFLNEESLRAYSDALEATAERLQADGVDLAGYTLAQRVDDLEAVRVSLGYERIDLISESVGTRIAMIYSWRYPESINRSVMYGANPPGHFIWDPRVTDEQIQYYGELVAKDAAWSARTDDLAASMAETAAQMPDRWWFLPIKEGNVRLGSFFGLAESTEPAAPLAGPETLDSWLSAAEGDASGFWFISLLADMAFPESFVWGELTATSRADAYIAEQYFSSGGDSGSILGNPGTEFLWGGGAMVEAWPANGSEDEYASVQTSDVETLLINGTVDFATPPPGATDELLPYLPNGHQVMLAELGHTTDFWNYQPEANARLINTFLDTGEVDDSLYTYRTMDFGAGVRHTALAKGIAITAGCLTLLAVFSLFWMAFWVRRRGGFGRKASTALRSVYTPVLGLGGWFLGVLIVMWRLPTVALDDPLLATLGVGLPIGLGIYLAWVRRDFPRSTKTAGFVGALVGALIGGWLGFSATTGLLALITTIVGAALGANLVLILFDISRERSAGNRPATANSDETPKARPSTG